MQLDYIQDILVGLPIIYKTVKMDLYRSPYNQTSLSQVAFRFKRRIQYIFSS